MERTLRKHLPGGVFGGVSPTRSRAMAAVRGHGNKTTERRLRLGLVRGGLRGWKVRPKGLRGNPDFFFPETRVAVFVDGVLLARLSRLRPRPANQQGLLGRQDPAKPGARSQDQGAT